MKSGNWREREEKLLHHIGLYRLSLRRIIERQFFDGGNSGNVIQRLLEDGRIQARDKGFRGRLSYYQLTLPEARRRGLPEERAASFGPQALHTHLAILWFCCASEVRRRRLEDLELEKLFDKAPPGVAHSAEAGRDPCVFRIHTVGPKTKIADLIKRLRGAVAAAPATPTVADWTQKRKYGFAVLAESDARCEAIRRSLQKSGLLSLARIHVERVPGPLTIHEDIHEHENE